MLNWWPHWQQHHRLSISSLLSQIKIVTTTWVSDMNIWHHKFLQTKPPPRLRIGFYRSWIHCNNSWKKNCSTFSQHFYENKNFYLSKCFNSAFHIIHHSISKEWLAFRDLSNKLNPFFKFRRVWCKLTLLYAFLGLAVPSHSSLNRVTAKTMNPYW